jgi:polyphenol oxidase
MDIVTISAFNLPHVRHAFFTRKGGVSSGIYSSLNCGLGSADDRDAVIENRARVSAHMNAALASVYQSHSADVVDVTQVFAERPKADGMVTQQQNIALGILAADCTPVLFADTQKQIIGACHAGWRGAFGGVADNTVAKMRDAGAESIVAAIGPCIRQPSYEVGPDFPDVFIAQDKGNQIFFTPKENGHYLFNLPAYITMRLQRIGVEVFDCGMDTYSEKDRFFSYRRDVTHEKGSDHGRLISCISLI